MVSEACGWNILKSDKGLCVKYLTAGRVVDLMDGSWVELLHQPNSGRARVCLPDILVLMFFSWVSSLVLPTIQRQKRNSLSLRMLCCGNLWDDLPRRLSEAESIEEASKLNQAAKQE